MGFSAAEAGIPTVEINRDEYTNVNDVHVTDNGGIFVSGANGMTVVSADQLPADFLKSWNINAQAAIATEKQKAEAQLTGAIANGSFRRVEGVVYDIRNPASGWVTYYSVSVIQVLDDGALIDLSPDENSYFPVHVRHLPNTISDNDRISFTAKFIGNFSYENKFGDERTVRDYDVGVVCSRGEIPDSVLSGRKAFDVMVQSGAPTGDVLAKLPESEDLQGNGSGFFITRDGYLITNYHVVKGANKVKIKNSSGIYPAEIVRTDPDDDLALLKVSGQFKSLPISKGGAQLGEAVFTIGFPDIILQGIQPKYTDGKISSLAGIRDDPMDYQISVPVQPGNSGGPLVDMTGKVVGIVEAKLDMVAALDVSGDLPQNVNYAIKSKFLDDFLEHCPEVKPDSSPAPSPNAVVSSAQQSVAMVLVY